MLAADLRIPNDRSFQTFDLGLTEAQRGMLAMMQIGRSLTYDNFGDGERLGHDIGRLCLTLGNKVQAACRQRTILNHTIGKIVTAAGSETAWVALRATTPSAAFDLPRWHVDGRFFESEAAQAKIAFTAKGVGTLLADIEDDRRQRLERISQKDRLARAAVVMDSYAPVPRGAGVTFKVGTPDAAIHSEPPLQAERLFVSIVPGSRAQIDDLRRRWRMAHTSLRYN